MRQPKKKGPDAANIWPLKNINTLDGAIDTIGHNASDEKFQAARYIAIRYRLPFSTAKLISELSGFGVLR